ELANGAPPPPAEVVVVTVPPLLASPRNAVIDPATGKLYAYDAARNAIYGWDRKQRDRFELVYGEDRRLDKPAPAVPPSYLAWDAQGDQLLFVSNGKLLGVDPVSGDLSV